MRRSRPIASAPSSLIGLFCLPAGLAAFRCRKTAFLKERLIGSGEGKILPTIAACKLHVSGHKGLRLVLLVGQLYSPFHKMTQRIGYLN
jgi:hypothetical protein